MCVLETDQEVLEKFLSFLEKDVQSPGVRVRVRVLRSCRGSGNKTKTSQDRNRT